MSGIFGILYRTECSRSLKRDVEQLLLWNRAYGREKEDIYFDTSAAFGCCYEKLSDELALGFPPKKNDDRFAVIDALLYNRDELAARCGLGCAASNEELLLCVLDRFGMDGLKEVNGDFAGILFHKKSGSITLFRDHMGVRPLFYYFDHQIAAFSTDIRGILALDGVDASINEDWIYRTCAGYLMDGLKATEFQHIFCIMPASVSTVSFREENTALKEHLYWQPGIHKTLLSSFGEYKKCLRELVTDAVKKRLDAVSGLVGAELSGGLDSGVIDILIHRLGRECIYHSWSVAPAQLPYADEDERLVISDICSQEGITCHFSDIMPDFGMDCNLAQRMKELHIPLDEKERPALRYVLPPYINTLNITRTAGFMKQNGVRAVFTGHGGDEGVSHRCNPYELFYHREYSHFFKQIWFSMHGQKRRAFKTLKKYYRILGPVRRMLRAPFRETLCAPELLNKEFAAKFQKTDMPVLHFAYSPIEYIKEGGSRNRLDNVALQGAYNGVRYLMPYLDYRVIDYAVSVPRHLYLSSTANRYLFREAFKDIMPDSLYQLNRKADGSIESYPEDTDWFDAFSQKRKQVYETLDRTLWKPYLDFQAIGDWIKQKKPPDEERFHCECMLMCLTLCTMAQNLIQKT